MEAGKGGGSAVLIAGPTASGKSALALDLAERIGGTVINADSMQVYRELRIITARPGPADEARVPHRLYGHVPAAEPYSVGRWLGDVTEVLAQGRPAIVVGGTGLYFRALTRGLAEIPPIPEAVRAFWRARAETLGGPALHAELTRRDRAMAARLDPREPQRIARALEVLDATGRSLADWQSETRPPPIGEGALRFVLDPPRPALRASIDARAAAMIRMGALDEVRRMLALGLDPALPAMKALGLAELGAVLTGQASLEQGLEAFRTATRRYARRQITWCRHQMADWPRLPALEGGEAVADVLAQAMRVSGKAPP